MDMSLTPSVRRRHLPLASMQQRKNGLFSRLPGLTSPTKGTIVNVVAHGQLRQRHPFTFVHHIAALTRVIALHVTTSPSAILRRIGAIHVNTVQRVSLRARPHVGQELRKRILPRVNHIDAATAVIRIVVVVGAIAAQLRRTPRHILWRIRSIRRRAVRGESVRGRLSGQASATHGLAASEVARRHFLLNATSAAAYPIGVSMGFGGASQHGPPSVCVAR